MSLKKMQKAYENKIEELNNQAVLQLRTNDNIEKTNNQQEMEEYDVFVSMHGRIKNLLRMNL